MLNAQMNPSQTGTTQNDTFGYNSRSELVSATLGSDTYAYAFDNIGNRETSAETTTALAYTANNLNQYTEIASSESSASFAFNPTYDADGNATLIRTSTGTWTITYNAENRPIRFENTETQTLVDCGYDSQGRRYFKKVTVAGTVTLHHRYIYRGYLQIACVDCTRSGHPALWLVTWDPSQATATRPLAIQKDGTWFTYGYDLTKNVCEVFGPAGYIRTAYSYAPFGNVTESGDVSQPFQWSSEVYDSELDLVYYNYRHYSPSLGRFLSRDPIAEQGGLNLYAFVRNNSTVATDYIGWSVSYEVLNRSVYGLTNHMPIFPACEKKGKCKWNLTTGDVVSTPPTVATTAIYTLRGSDGFLYRAECKRLPEGIEETRKHEEAHIQNMQNAVKKINSDFNLPREFEQEISCKNELDKLFPEWKKRYNEEAYRDKEHLGDAPRPSDPTFHQEHKAGLCTITQL